MFTLIIAIISIALIVATIAATMYHGGDTLTQGRTAADAAAFVTGAQQISGAEVMHLSLTSTVATTVSGGTAGTDLVLDKYLNSAPVVKGGAWTLDTVNKLVQSSVNDDAVCIQINKAAGMAAATADANKVAEADFASLPYGCVSATKNFEFKY
jgi:hypothetical protein